MGGLRIEPFLSALEENIGARRGVGREVRLERDVSELRVLDGEDQLLRLFGIGRGHGKGTRVARERMKAEDGLRDHTESAEGAGDELGKVVASDVLDDFPAAPGERAVGERDSNADDEVTKRAEAQAKGAAVVGREDAANGGSFGPQRIESEALAVLGEGFLQSLNGAASFDGDSEVGPGVFQDAVHSRS